MRLHSVSLRASPPEKSQESYEQFRIKQSEASEPKMAHSTLLSTYSGLLWLGWPISHHGCWEGVTGSRAFLCTTTAARASQYGGDLWMSPEDLNCRRRTTKYRRLVERSHRWMVEKKKKKFYWLRESLLEKAQPERKEQVKEIKKRLADKKAIAAAHVFSHYEQ